MYFASPTPPLSSSSSSHSHSLYPALCQSSLVYPTVSYPFTLLLGSLFIPGSLVVGPTCRFFPVRLHAFPNFLFKLLISFILAVPANIHDTLHRPFLYSHFS
ncbi:hypothetical protein BV22DRAFT_734541 [Leucogyrophana mollusca]|uniref:Uncharacterized protein n=1 Tax=Leucogyrophana mollusca TaxID=85980 RepID=A0ACB8B9E3_9AGAM|nr:hypothetical protein BV22DRAFT_734541 [Leucogyrophana mollusca]